MKTFKNFQKMKNIKNVGTKFIKSQKFQKLELIHVFLHADMFSLRNFKPIGISIVIYQVYV